MVRDTDSQDGSQDGGGDDSTDTPGFAHPPVRRRARLWLLGGGAVAAAALAGVWADRFDLADRIVAGELQRLKLHGAYRIAEIGLTRQVLEDVRIGSPATIRSGHPDFAAERVEIETGLTGIQRITLLHPRLAGDIRNGHLSLGSLDALFKGPPSATPLRLPDWGLRLVDARAGIGGDAGPIGLGLNGEGNLHDGFAGVAALSAPRLAGGGCTGENAGFLGRLVTAAGRPRLTGTLSMARIACAAGSLAAPRVAVDARLAPALDGGDVQLGLSGGRLAGTKGDVSASGLSGTAQAGFGIGSGRRLAAGGFHVALAGLAGSGMEADALAFDGRFRLAMASGHIEADGTLAGSGLTPAATTLAALDRARVASAGTLAAPLLASALDVLARTKHAGSLSGNWLLRDGGPQGDGGNGRWALVVPQADLTDRDGQALVEVSRLRLGPGGLSGALLAEGGLPPLSARIEADERGGTRAVLSMAPWQAGDASLAIPRLDVSAGRGGRVGLAGMVLASGPVPGGTVSDVSLPLSGVWDAAGGLRLGTACTPVAYQRIALASLTLDAGHVTLCPDHAPALLVAGPRGVRLAMRSDGVDAAGKLGAQALAATGGALSLSSGNGAGAGGLAVQHVQVALGSGDAISHFALANLAARFDPRSASPISGQFDGGQMALAPVPLDFGAGTGTWRWANGRLQLEDAAFQVSDRLSPARFQPLTARDATLSLAGGVIHGEAVLHEPKSGRAVAHVTLSHDLGTVWGEARFSVDNLAFDKGFQPNALTPLTLGVIADAKGAVSGEGRVAWAGGKVTSSGHFSTPGFDFAAPFGPVEGVAGSVAFTDLIGLVTAPDQRLTIASINPGIEVKDGTLSFAMQPGYVLKVNGAEWPFLDGRLRLLPTRMVLGATEVRHYVLKVEGLNAAKFLQHMEISNLAATGSFDGVLPLVFDGTDGSIVGGKLISRPPGGSVSYVGALTYKNVGPFTNYAFRMLRSLKYRRMELDMNGSLSGEVVTGVAMSGVEQGPGASKNFLTRQVAHVPIQFNINIRAPFYQLIGSYRSFSDPKLLADPRSLGLIGADGKPIAGVKPVQFVSGPFPDAPVGGNRSASGQ